MKLNDKEKRLLRQQAEAYAFIYDLRQVAIERADRVYILMTAGIEDVIERRRQEYPGTFQRYFGEAIFRAKAEKLKMQQAQEEKLGEREREEASRRQEETSQKVRRPSKSERKPKTKGGFNKTRKE